MNEKLPTIKIESEGEKNLVILILGLSVLVHIILYSVSELDFLSQPDDLQDEWSIDVSLSSEKVESVAALPKAKKKEEPKVPEKMLPQLPKTFKIDQPKAKDEDAIAEATKPQKKPEPKKEEKKAPPPVNDHREKEAAKKLKKEEALKRLALERLRSQKKLAKTMEAPEKNSKPKLGKATKSNTKRITLGAAGKTYLKLLEQQIKRHYTLPHTFSSPIARLEVTVAIVVNSRGDLMSVKVDRSSMDPVFDDYTIQAARKAAPYQRPPRSLAGQTIRLRFTR